MTTFIGRYYPVAAPTLSYLAARLSNNWDYVWGASPPHTDYNLNFNGSPTFTPDGKVLLVTDPSGLLAFNSLNLAEPPRAVTAVAVDLVCISPDSNTAVVYTRGTHLTMGIDIATGEELWSINTSMSGMGAAHPDFDMFAHTNDSGTVVRLRRISTGELVDVGYPNFFTCSPTYITSLTFTAHGSFITVSTNNNSGINDAVTNIGNFPVGDLIVPTGIELGRVRSIQYSKDGQYIAFCNADGTVLITDGIRTPIITLTCGPTLTRESAAFSNDSKSFAVSSVIDNTGITIYNTQDWSIKSTIPLNANASALSFSGPVP